MKRLKDNISEVEGWQYIKRKLLVGEPLQRCEERKLLNLLHHLEGSVIPRIRQIENYKKHYMQFVYLSSDNVPAIEEQLQHIKLFEERFIDPINQECG